MAQPTDSQTWKKQIASVLVEQAKIRLGGGTKALERQHAKGRLSARERVALLIDPAPSDTSDHQSDPETFQELALWSAWNMYPEAGGAPAAGVITAIANIHARPHMVIANDATVKAGAFFPMTCKKIIRAQHIAQMARLPLIYLVDSAGVFLPMQEDVFPDTDDFGRIFYLNSILSAQGIPQIAAIMGYCVAGGGYLPVLCDTLLMTEGSGLYLAGQALVKAAIGQEVSDEELGGAEMHAEISGTIDFQEPNDHACIERIRSLVQKSNPAEPSPSFARPTNRAVSPFRPPTDIYNIFTTEPAKQYDTKDIIACIVDSRAESDAGPESSKVRDSKQTFLPDAGPESSKVRDSRRSPPPPTDAGHESSKVRDSRRSPPPPTDAGHEPSKGPGSKNLTLENTPALERLAPDFDEYKADYGQSIVCGYANIAAHPVAIVANQGKLTQQAIPGGKSGPSKSANMPRVIYAQAADKAARFIMDCNQRKIPIIFMHDTTGFMVGRDSEQAGIIRAGAKLVNAMSNSIVPKISLIMGGSFGAGHYAMCGRAFEPFLTLAWPGACYSVMGAAQASGVLAMIEERGRKRKGEQIDAETHEQILAAVRASYDEQQDIRYGAARGWVDRIIEPHKTREELIAALEATRGWDYEREFKTGVLQT